MKRIIVFFMLISLAMAGCRREDVQPDTPNALVPSILYNGEIYRSTGKQVPAEVDESAIIGTVTSTVPLSQWPTEEGQANFEILDAPYAMTADGLLVLVEHEWTLFEPLDISE